MDKQKMIDELNGEIKRIEGNDNRYPRDAYWAGSLQQHLEIIKDLVEDYDQERAEKNYY